MHAAEHPLGATERMLEGAELPEQDRSTLWLFAWALYENLGHADSPDLRMIEGGGAG